MSETILVQRFEQAINGWWDGGPKSEFRWRVERDFPDGMSRVGSWGANRYFEVKTGKDDKATLDNARRKLAVLAKNNLRDNPCKFSYKDEG